MGLSRPKTQSSSSSSSSNTIGKVYHVSSKALPSGNTQNTWITMNESTSLFEGQMVETINGPNINEYCVKINDIIKAPEDLSVNYNKTPPQMIKVSKMLNLLGPAPLRGGFQLRVRYEHRAICVQNFPGKNFDSWVSSLNRVMGREGRRVLVSEDMVEWMWIVKDEGLSVSD